MTSPAVPAQNASRIASLDQFRGYTVAGMFLVNFLGWFAQCPRLLKHSNDYCSYADTIMPQFLFAVGFAFRLTFQRRVERAGAAAAYRRVIRRLLALALVALVVYVLIPHAFEWHEKFVQPWGTLLYAAVKRDWFQTLLHIAVTSLWILPVIRLSIPVRIAYAAESALLHVLLSAWFNFEWVNSAPGGIDGGPLGFLTWTLPAITGTIACDIVTKNEPRIVLRRLLSAGAALMFAGWLLSCGTRLYDVRPASKLPRPNGRLARSPVVPPAAAWGNRPLTTLLAEPPFVPPPTAKKRHWNYWMMSQRAGTPSYLLFASGVSLVVFAAFSLACDVWKWKSAFLQTLGTNALAGYVLHDPIGRLVQSFTKSDVSAGMMWLLCALYFGLTWTVLRWLERRGLVWRL